MASTKSLEDMLSSDVDESAVSALVGSLESQLASPTIHVPSPDISSTPITNNHVNNTAVMDTFVNRIHHHQNPQPTPQPSDAVQKHGILGIALTSTGSSAITNSSTSSSSDPAKTSVPFSAPITPIATSTTVQGNPTYTVSLPGAIPASGYINQFQPVTMSGSNPGGVMQVQRATTIPNGNASNSGVAGNVGTGAIAAALAATTPKVSLAATVVGTSVVSTTAPAPVTAVVAKPGAAIPAATTVNIGAIHNLASVAARQPPLVIPPSSQQHHQATHQHVAVTGGQPATIQANAGQTVIAVAKTIPQPTVASGAQVTSVPGAGTPINVMTQVMNNPQILQGMQFVNVNPLRAGAPSAPGQKNIAPRIVLSNQLRIAAGPQMIGARPGTQPVQNAITLPRTFFLKTENGQLQVVNVNAPFAPGTTAYRLQTIPQGTPNRTLSSQQMNVTLPVSHANQHVKVQQPQQSPHMLHTVLQAAHSPAVSMVSSTSMPHSTTTHTAAVASSPSIVQQVGVRGSPVVPVHQPISGHPQTVAVTTTQAAPSAVLASTATTPTLTSAVPSATTSTATASGAQSTTAPQMSPDTAKKKCKNFLSTLLRLASDQPEQVATNVKNLIQGLIDGIVPPEDFTNQLQKELNSSPQPCLIPFLKKSLPYLRHSLTTKELSIEGVRPPPPELATLPPTPTIIPQIQLASSTTPSPMVPRAVFAPPVRLLTPSPAATAPATHLTQPVITELASTSLPTQRVPAPRKARVTTPRSQPLSKQATQRIAAAGTTPPTGGMLGPIGSGTIRPIVSTASSLAFTRAVVSSLRASLTPPRMASVAGAPLRTTAPMALTQALASSSPAPLHTVASGSSASSPMATIASTATAATTTKSEKEKRSFSSVLKDDDDINDVAAMGGVNLVEESARIMAQNAEFVGTQIRSCKDENFLFTGPLQRRIRTIAAKYNLDEPSPEVVAIVSHATQERLKDIVAKLGVIAEHRIEIVKSDSRHEVSQDVKGQLKFLEELDRLEKKRHEEQERELLLRAAKSRSKLEDPEQLKLKQKAKEMQRAEMEEMRQREANMTALLAIGPRKKFKADSQAGGTNDQQSGSSVTQATPGSSGFNSSSSRVQRPRVKRVNLRDLLFLMEQERETCRSLTLYKACLK